MYDEIFEQVKESLKKLNIENDFFPFGKNTSTEKHSYKNGNCYHLHFKTMNAANKVYNELEEQFSTMYVFNTENEHSIIIY